MLTEIIGRAMSVGGKKSNAMRNLSNLAFGAALVDARIVNVNSAGPLRNEVLAKGISKSSQNESIC